MRKALSLVLLAFGSLLFAVAWASPEVWRPGWVVWLSFGAALMFLSWGARGQYEPLALLATGLLAGTVYAALVAFHEIATSGGQATGEDLVPYRNLFACSASIGLLALLRAQLASSRPPGRVLAWVVLIQGAWWAWYLESVLILPLFSETHFVNRGRVVLLFALGGSLVLAHLVVGWLRRTSRPRLARIATSLSAVVILGIGVRGCRELETDEEIYTSWWPVPVSTSTASERPPPDAWMPTIRFLDDGRIDISREILSLEQVEGWLLLSRRRMAVGERLSVQPDSGATFASLLPVLQTCRALGPPFEVVNLVVRSPRTERRWREVLADHLPFRPGKIPLRLYESTPPGVPELALGSTDGDWPRGDVREITLRIDPHVRMDRVVDSLDRLRDQGCVVIGVLVAPE